MASATSFWQNASSRRSPGSATAFAAFGFDQGDDFLRVGFFGGKVIDRDIGAFAGVGDRGGPAHPGITAGNERLATGQTAGAVVALLAVVRPRIHLAGEAGPGLLLAFEGRLRIFFGRVL